MNIVHHGLLFIIGTT